MITLYRCYITYIFLAACALAATSGAPTEADGVTVEPTAALVQDAQREKRMAWWREAKFGMFIHWGVYAVPAGAYRGETDYGEWIMNSAKISVADYRTFAQAFNPAKYNPDAWAALAQEAGMRYLVITAKHHDGFALFPSHASHWNVADATPYGKDLLGPLVKAAKDRRLGMGFYYSQAQDWVNPGGAKSRYQEPEGWDPAQKGSFDAYLSKVALPQVQELLANYPIDILWWDTPTWMNPARIAPFAKVVSEHPQLVTNDRLGAGAPGDIATAEQFVPVTGVKGDWETCMTLNNHWGYNAADQNWQSTGQLIRNLAEICGKGGNFLLNVGPTAEGEIPAPCVQRLKEIGAWLRVNGDAIYGTERGPFLALSWGCATRRGNRLYLHVFEWPKDRALRVPLHGASGRAWLLIDPTKAPLGVTREANRLLIALPPTAPDPADSVVVLDLDRPPQVRPLASAGAHATVSATAPGSDPAYALDGTGEKRWRAPADQKSAWLVVDLGESRAVAGYGFDEPDVWPRLRQAYVLEYETPTGWRKITEGETSGHGDRLFFPEVRTRRIRLLLTCASGGPGVAEIQLYSPE